MMIVSIIPIKKEVESVNSLLKNYTLLQFFAVVYK